jgi:ATPase family associated with various cellular activities (AAA)
MTAVTCRAYHLGSVHCQTDFSCDDCRSCATQSGTERALVSQRELVQTVAAEANARVYNVTPADITGAYLGESERRLRETFDEAEAVAAAGGAALVFIDEIDALCPKRGRHSAHGSRVVTQLLTLLDGAASATGSAVRCDPLPCIELHRVRRGCPRLRSFEVQCWCAAIPPIHAWLVH